MTLLAAGCSQQASIRLDVARPVKTVVVLATVLGMIPLLKDPFFGAMAVCIMFGLSFAAVLSLILTPVLYAIFYGVHENPAATKKEAGLIPAEPKEPQPSSSP
jgi:hypothetical protein